MRKRYAGASLLLVLAACATAGAPATGRGVGPVIVAENMWGSIASQLGGAKVSVTSIVTNPNTDPHAYEPSTADARRFATAGVVIENGIGYDGWAQKLIDANPVASRSVLVVGDIVGVKEGGNPHQWYSPDSVRKVIDAIVAVFKSRDPAEADYFDSRQQTFLGSSLARYTQTIRSIATKFAGVPVGASESIFEPLASATKLRLLTPPSLLRAISQGVEPTVADRSIVDRQIQARAFKVYVFNRQNSTPDVARQVDACRKQGIPVVGITETLAPATASFQEWQLRQLSELEAALANATGKAS